MSRPSTGGIVTSTCVAWCSAASPAPSNSLGGVERTSNAAQVASSDDDGGLLLPVLVLVLAPAVVVVAAVAVASVGNIVTNTPTVFG